MARPPTLKAPAADTEATFAAFTAARTEPPVYAHWRALFCDKSGKELVALLMSAADRDGPGLFLQQLLNDRMLATSFIAVADPREIHPDDEDYPPAFDPLGLPYDPQFTDRLRDGFRYTRFRHWGTTYYGNGPSFAMVCDTGDFTDNLLNHFRRHYTHMVVIAHYQHAALLYFEAELAHKVKLLADRDSETEYDHPEWRARLRTLQQRFLKFRSRASFTEVSNQLGRGSRSVRSRRRGDECRPVVLVPQIRQVETRTTVCGSRRPAAGSGHSGARTATAPPTLALLRWGNGSAGRQRVRPPAADVRSGDAGTPWGTV